MIDEVQKQQFMCYLLGVYDGTVAVGGSVYEETDTKVPGSHPVGVVSQEDGCSIAWVRYLNRGTFEQEIRQALEGARPSSGS